MMERKNVAVVACAGMDKALGSVARVSVFKVVETLRPDKAELICLPPLLAEVSTYSMIVARLPVVVVDGCAERCATKLIVKNGGKIRGRILVLNSAKNHSLVPKSASDIGPDGEKLAAIIAEEVAALVDRLIEKE